MYSVRAQIASRKECKPIVSIRDLFPPSSPPPYDAILLDQFGVLHDGKHVIPSALQAVAYLAEQQIPILLVSNSSRRSSGALASLEARYGYKQEWFRGVITSGELTWRHLTDRPDAFWQGLGRRCIHFTWSERGAISLDGLGLERIHPFPSSSSVTPLFTTLPDFLLAHGTEAVDSAAGLQRATLDQLVAILDRCLSLASQLRVKPPPLIIANPDIVTVDGDGLAKMPGWLGQQYAAKGGHVVLMGKPSSVVYDEAMRQLGGTMGSGGALRLLAIGDSLEHDVAGAQKCGINTVFVVTSGIHRRDVEGEGTWCDQAKLRSLASSLGCLDVPDYCVKTLC